MKNHFFQLKGRIFRPTVRNTLSWLSDLNNLPNNKLRDLHERRRTKMVLHAFENTDFYHEKYTAAGLTRADLARPENFRELPVLTREEVRVNFDAMISRDISPEEIGRSSTGGSTGSPIEIGTDPRLALEVISWRRLNYWGASPGDNSGYIYRVIPSGIGHFARRVFFYPTRRSYLSATQMSDANIAGFVDEILRSRAVYLVAYVGALKILADYVLNNDIRLPHLKFIWSTAAPLPVYLRNELEAVFNVPVYSQYGSAEFYWIASERRDRVGLDVDWDIRSVEILDGEKQHVLAGSYGDLFVSDLCNCAFPLLRYEIGDRGRFLPASNDHADSLPILDFVRGRTSDTFLLRNGRRVPGEFWTTIFDPYADAISGFSVHQRQDRSIIVGFTPNKTWSGDLERELAATIQSICEDTPFELKAHSETRNDRGKLQYITSEI
ncbi:hypothetical protein N9876_00815 [bacterium]|nr:hypothetical protein [bacterium]